MTHPPAMPTDDPPGGTLRQARRPSSQRRADVLAAAIPIFASRGYGAPTAEIAAHVGISEPYLYRLFETKRNLFLSCHDVVHRRIRQVLAEGAQRDGRASRRLRRMRHAYATLLTAQDRQLQLRVHLEPDPVIRAVARARLLELLADVSRLSGATPAAARALYGQLMVLSVADVIGLRHDERARPPRVLHDGGR